MRNNSLTLLRTKDAKQRRANLVQNRILSAELQISLPQTHDRIT